MAIRRLMEVMLLLFSFTFFSTMQTPEMPILPVVLIFQGATLVLLFILYVLTGKLDQKGDDMELEELESLNTKWALAHTLFMGAIVGQYAVLSLAYFLAGEYFMSAMLAFVGAALFYIMNQAGKDHRKKVAKLIGAKSQALLDRIQVAVPAPLTNPA